MTLFTAFITLVLVMDAAGNVPIFLSLLKDIEPKRRQLIVLREMLVAFLILTLFLFFGSPILSGLNISEAALEIAGGIILFLIAIRMIFPLKDQYQDEQLDGEPFIVPLAIPLIAGPSALATVIIFATQEPERMGVWFLALVLASSFGLLMLLSANLLMKLLGKKGLMAVERLMGMILTTVAVQMFLDGIRLYFLN